MNISSDVGFETDKQWYRILVLDGRIWGPRLSLGGNSFVTDCWIRQPVTRRRVTMVFVLLTRIVLYREELSRNSGGQLCHLPLVNYYYYYYLLLAYSPVNCSGSPQGFAQVQISHTRWIQYKTCTLHKRKTYKNNRKGSPFGIAGCRKKWQIKLGDAGQYSPSEMFCPHEKYSAKIGD